MFANRDVAGTRARHQEEVNYLRTVQLDCGLLTATGTVLPAGSRVGFAEGAVTDASGAGVATASSTLLVVDNHTRI